MGRPVDPEVKIITAESSSFTLGGVKGRSRGSSAVLFTETVIKLALADDRCRLRSFFSSETVAKISSAHALLSSEMSKTTGFASSTYPANRPEGYPGSKGRYTHPACKIAIIDTTNSNERPITTPIIDPGLHPASTSCAESAFTAAATCPYVICTPWQIRQRASGLFAAFLKKVS